MSGHHDEPSRLVDSEESLLEERELADAFRAVRDRYDGEHETADTTLQRALFQTRVHRRRQRFTRWIVLPAAAVLVASTAWAGVTGRLSPAVRTMLESIYEAPSREDPRAGRGASARPTPTESPSEQAPAAAPPPETAAEPATAALPTETPPVTTSEPPPSAPVALVPATPSPVSAPSTAPAPSAKTSAAAARRSEVVAAAPSTAAASSSTAAIAASPAISPPTPPAASASDPYAPLFAEAHRVHFTERDPARAIAAWDRYLDAAPSGRFAPEARYNRAIALVRLGRKTEAQQELAVFANGMYGEYRRADAKALLDALARDGGD